MFRIFVIFTMIIRFCQSNYQEKLLTFSQTISINEDYAIFLKSDSEFDLYKDGQDIEKVTGKRIFFLTNRK